MNAKQIAAVKKVAIDRYSMRVDGIHGPSHWERVRENAIYLTKHSGGDVVVGELFAYLHDCCRESDGSDRDHGLRAARFTESLSDDVIQLDANQIFLLTYACEHHEKGRTSEDPTIGACWDADRLDLGRVAIKPIKKFLSTDRAKLDSVIEWGYKRSRGHRAKLKN